MLNYFHDCIATFQEEARENERQGQSEKVCECLTCADPEIFMRGGPTKMVIFGHRRGGPTLKKSRNYLF